MTPPAAGQASEATETSTGTAKVAMDPAFAGFVAQMREAALASGVSARIFDRAFAGLEPDPEILALLDRQPEHDSGIWDYIDRMVSEERIALGQAALIANRGLLDAIEGFYGVDRHVVVAIWGMESKYGGNAGSRNVVRSLATLAYAGGRRTDYGRTQLLAALRILEKGDIAPERMLGSWAGAMGHTQFIPTTFEAYAVDFDRDGHRDIWSNVGDALASTASYLARSGWRSGETWGYEVTLPAGFDYALAGTREAKPIRSFMKLGVRRVAAQDFPDPDRPSTLLLPAGARGPAFLVSTNFRAILRYNNAVAYGLAVGHLADRLAGRGPIVQQWPRDERPLSRDEREELQRLLSASGYELGEPDGLIGSATKAALRAYQRARGLPPDGFPTIGLLERLRAEART
ncbi:MAG: lytic murein transglycosylase [Hyphomicrobiaceae bacterium]